MHALPTCSHRSQRPSDGTAAPVRQPKRTGGSPAYLGSRSRFRANGALR